MRGHLAVDRVADDNYAKTASNAAAYDAARAVLHVAIAHLLSTVSLTGPKPH